MLTVGKIIAAIRNNASLILIVIKTVFILFLASTAVEALVATTVGSALETPGLSEVSRVTRIL
jgi:hypothetical protein